ncbi:hypothetical protein SCLCIDRAFT_114970, partial [Scleroderma citrinum Foug A]
SSRESVAPPSKRVKVKEEEGAPSTQHGGNGASGKFINCDLPTGCQDRNLWRGVFIPSLAHWCGGYVDPWTIESLDLQDRMQVIWDEEYCGKLNHTITIKGPVFHVAKQRLNEWQSGFAAMVIMILATFFIHDPDFHDPQEREKNHGPDSKLWTGIWHSPFVLQTFASHFNFISGHAEIPELDSEKVVPHVALALAATAVCHAFSLAACGELHLRCFAETGMTWEVTVPDGESYGFNIQTWGKTSRKLFQLILSLTRENFVLIVDEVQCYLKAGTKGKGVSATSGVEDSYDEELYDFR